MGTISRYISTHSESASALASGRLRLRLRIRIRITRLTNHSTCLNTQRKKLPPPMSSIKSPKSPLTRLPPTTPCTRERAACQASGVCSRPQGARSSDLREYARSSIQRRIEGKGGSDECSVERVKQKCTTREQMSISVTGMTVEADTTLL